MHQNHRKTVDTSGIKVLSIIIQTYNEAENIKELIEEVITVADCLRRKYEILIVDSASCDNTAHIAKKILNKAGRVISCAPKESLAVSVIKGFREARGDVFIVMDADGSHPVGIIPELVKAIDQGYDLVIGSRYVSGAEVIDFSPMRRISSYIGCFSGSFFCKVKDNASGFFCLRKKVIDGVKFTPLGFKIGLEIFAKGNYSSFRELPYAFRSRKKGKSKFRPKVIMQYLLQLVLLTVYKIRSLNVDKPIPVYPGKKICN